MTAIWHEVTEMEQPGVRAPASVRGSAMVGDFFHAPSMDELIFMGDTMLVVDDGGYISMVLPPGDPRRSAVAKQYEGKLVRLPPGTYGMPGFVDLHVHAPQYPQIGMALDEPLEVWLQRYTFPLEAQYSDLALAEDRYRILVQDMLRNGTTTALYFATQHVEASKLLADICLEKGQRALVGKVAMDDRASCPENYRDEDADQAVEGTREVIDYIINHPRNSERRVLPVVTPRFTPSCSDSVLSGLGTLARERDCHVQTHCSESDWAHQYALSRFGVTDAEALDNFGLLTRKTILAHSNFLTDADMDRVRMNGSGIAHCALSNIYFANSVFPLRKALDRHLHVGLGSDISGGPVLSMFDACRSTVQSSRMLETGVDPNKPAGQRGRPGSAVNLVNAFHLATAGGGVALDLPVGRLDVGFHFDVIFIDAHIETGNIRLFDVTEPSSIFEKILYGATRNNITSTWVGGLDVDFRREVTRVFH